MALAAAALLFCIAAVESRPPHRLTIETGPVGGSYHQVAERYREILARRGIDVVIRPQPSSLEIVRNVADPQSPVQVGFIAQDVAGMADQPVRVAGQIQLQPLFVFASAELGRRSGMDALRGRRLVMPPRDSATSDAAVKVLRLYDITEENTSFTFMPLADAAKALQAGQFAAGVFMLAPENPVIRELAADSSLRLMPYAEARAVASQLPFLRPVVLPRGIYNIADAIPPYDTPMVAATVGVVVKETLHPFLAYSLLEAMSSVHRGPTLISAAGEFPTLAGAPLAAHPLAMDFHRAGLPWAYQALPPWLASMAGRHGVVLMLLAAAMVAVMGVCRAVDLVGACAEAAALWALRRAERAAGSTGDMNAAQTARLDRAAKVLRWLDPEHPALAMHGRLRGRILEMETASPPGGG